jgi:hypothetical protein
MHPMLDGMARRATNDAEEADLLERVYLAAVIGRQIKRLPNASIRSRIEAGVQERVQVAENKTASRALLVYVEFLDKTNWFIDQSSVLGSSSVAFPSKVFGFTPDIDPASLLTFVLRPAERLFMQNFGLAPSSFVTAQETY